jgi:trigger factor
MKIDVEQLKDNQTKLTIDVDAAVIARAKKAVINEHRPQVKAKGFREGKAPDKVVEKEVGAEHLQADILDRALSIAYSQALKEHDIEPLAQPEVNVTKFVPYDQLEFTATVEHVPDIKLPKYDNLKVDVETKEVTDDDIEEVLNNIAMRSAESEEVERAAKDGDKVTIDFEGKNPESGDEVPGASGSAYPLQLGSGNFIEGFEPEVIGLKAGDEKTFTITFPDDYRVESLKDQKVEFTVTVHTVEEVKKPEIDDEFAKKLGPFDDLKALKSDVRTELEAENNQRAERDRRQKTIEALVDKIELDTPPNLLERVTEEVKNELQQNLMQRGMTLDQYLQQQGVSEEEFETGELKEQAEKRAKSSLVLTELAKDMELDVTEDELETQMNLLSEQYSDEKMQEELKKPEARREVAAQILTQKTITKLVELNS